MGLQAAKIRSTHLVDASGPRMRQDGDSVARPYDAEPHTEQAITTSVLDKEETLTVDPITLQRLTKWSASFSEQLIDAVTDEKIEPLRTKWVKECSTEAWSDLASEVKTRLGTLDYEDLTHLHNDEERLSKQYKAITKVPDPSGFALSHWDDSRLDQSSIDDNVNQYKSTWQRLINEITADSVRVPEDSDFLTGIDCILSAQQVGLRLGELTDMYKGNADTD